MNPKCKLFTALAMAALAVPALALAQQSYSQPQDPQSAGATPYSQSQSGYGQQAQAPEGYGEGQGAGPGDQPTKGAGKHKHQKQASVYPQFHSLEKRIKHTLHEERKSNTLAASDAHNLKKQLRQIQAEEQSLYQAHGANLPPDAQARIQGELTQLAQTVDRSRNQTNPGQAYQGRQ